MPNEQSNAIKARLTGITPLVMCNNRTAHPLDEYTLKIKEITSKRKKTEADHRELMRLEFLAHLYLNGNGPMIPSHCIKATLVASAKREKLGSTFQDAIQVLDDADIEYDGPRDPKEMWEDGRFTWATLVGNKQSTVLRTRPKFAEWSCNISVFYESSMVNAGEIERALDRGRISAALLDARALGYGHFSFEILKPELVC